MHFMSIRFFLGGGDEEQRKKCNRTNFEKLVKVTW